MSLNSQARPSFRFRHQSRQKDNRYSVQCRIGLNPSGDFAAIRFRHHDIEEDQVRLKALGCLMSFARVVLFTDEVATRPLERDLGRVGEVSIVIDYQNGCFFLHRFRNLREKVYFDCSVHNFSSDILWRRPPNRSAH